MQVKGSVIPFMADSISEETFFYRLHSHEVEKFVFWMNTFPAESGGAWRCSRSLATSRLPYLEATCRGVKPFCGEKHTKKYLKQRMQHIYTQVNWGQTSSIIIYVCIISLWWAVFTTSLLLTQNNKEVCTCWHADAILCNITQKYYRKLSSFHSTTSRGSSLTIIRYIMRRADKNHMTSVFMTQPCPRRERSFVCQTLD